MTNKGPINPSVDDEDRDDVEDFDADYDDNDDDDYDGESWSTVWTRSDFTAWDDEIEDYDGS